MKLKHLTFVAALAFFGAVSGPTFAAIVHVTYDTFDFNFSDGSGDNASFQFLTTYSGNDDVYNIASISGNASFSTIDVAGTISGPDFSVPGADNWLYPNTPPYVDSAGASFDVTDTSGDIYAFLMNSSMPPYGSTVGFDPDIVYQSCTGSNCPSQTPGTLSGNLDPVVTPLPPALPLFATALSILGLLGWRRKRKALAA